MDVPKPSLFLGTGDASSLTAPVRPQGRWGRILVGSVLHLQVKYPPLPSRCGGLFVSCVIAKAFFSHAGVH
jgi:hypothetical protein